MRKYKTIMELIFIFLLPLILILSGINLKEEQITTNNGYEWNTYIEYNNKILVDMGEYKNVIQNFNLWNEEWELGIYNENGEKTSSTSYIRSKTKIEVQPNTTIYFKSSNSGRICFYTQNNTFISRTNYIGLDGNFNIPNNCYYITFFINETTYENNICINESITWANGNYEPYGKPLIIYSQTDISGQNNRIYTPFGEIKKLLINNLKIQETTTTNIIFDYTILWFLMFILWHILYLFFDMLIHLFIDWGHKEKEKING